MSKECKYCGFRDPMPFTCKFCGSTFCYNHRLPESHNCPGLASYKERVRASGKLSQKEPDLIARKRRDSIFRPLANALSVIKSNYSLSILVIAIISFILQYIPGYSSFFALSPSDIFNEPWKFAINLVTHIFLHGDAYHLFFNMLFLFFFGPELERRIGGKRFLAVFFMSGIIAAIGYTLWSFFTFFVFDRPLVSAIGASGAIFGIFACLTILAPHMRIYVIFIPMRITEALIFFALLDLLLIGSGDPIARSAHLSGVIAGLIIGWYIKKKGKYLRG
ncbi:MAG: rhomboid family intramembrane serine protease [Candidatus Methanoperedens sp.]|nr:rhomboid family intramembrane serine protease [Candidatus Methanoperedens sp.]